MELSEVFEQLAHGCKRHHKAASVGYIDFHEWGKKAAQLERARDGFGQLAVEVLTDRSGKPADKIVGLSVRRG